MNLGELQNKLTAAARAQAPDERVPYAFEKRITALLAARGVPDFWTIWSRGMWRAAVSCVVVAVVCGTLSLLVPSASEGSPDLSQEFENTLLASVDQGDLSSMP
jgi:anti-sigma-K factor RskA